MLFRSAKRIGPVLKETLLTSHDVAVLWSFTELAMREEDITLQEASKKTGEQIKLRIASLPENSAFQSKEIASTPTTSAATTKSPC